MIPDGIIQQYRLQNFSHQGFVYMEIQKGMHGMPQAVKIAYDILKQHMENLSMIHHLLIPDCGGNKHGHINFRL